MSQMLIKLITPTQKDFFKIADFSFENFIQETAKSTGETFSALKEKVGTAPNTMSANDIWYLIEYENYYIGYVWIRVNHKERTAFGYDIHLYPKYRSQG